MIWENIKLALRSMKGSKMRTVLSLLGIIIGVGSVVTILNLGDSATSSITSSISSSGYDTLYLTPSASAKVADTFTEAFGQELMNNVDGIDVVLPQNTASTRIRYNKEITTATIMGVESNFAQSSDYSVADGSWFSAEDNIFKRQVVVLGSDVAETLFPDGNAIGSYVSIFRNQSKRYLVIGIMDDKDPTLGGTYNSAVYIPYNTYTQRFQKTNTVGRYTVRVSKDADPITVSKAIEDYLDELVGNDYYMLFSSASLAEMASSITGTLSIFLAAIGGISLLVGGIGIMNIMLVSVAERTKEIGIRKALGAPPSVIRVQFLIEAITLTSIGGFLGIIIGITVSRIVTNIAGWGFSISINACILSVAFSMAIGIFFGLYPAAKAAKLDPIESLNYE